MSALRDEVVALVRKNGLKYREEPFKLASGEFSHDYMDAKRGLAEGEHLELASEAMLELARDEGVEFDAVGGLELGAVPFTLMIARAARTKWFVVRKEPKSHGPDDLIAGAEIGPGMRVLLVDDVVTMGGSILQALDAVRACGAEVVLAVTLVDRGDNAAPKFEDLGVPYRALITYTDLGIAPIGNRATATAG